MPGNSVPARSLQARSCNGLFSRFNLSLKFLITILFLSLTPSLWSLNFMDDKDPDLLAKELCNAMTDNELLGQVLMYGWENGREDDLSYWIGQGLGNIKVFGWNGGDSVALCESIARFQREGIAENRFDIPLFVATDQEGGWVRHVTDSTSETPGNMAIGASGLAQDSYESSYLIAQELRSLGINMNFAPDVDIYINKGISIVSSRAFSSDPQEVAWLSLAWYKGQQRSGVVATAKHFPGHGAADKDSHGGLPIIHRDLETLKEEDLLPYRLLIHEGMNAIMVGHLGFPEITDEIIPSSRSHFFLTELLREDMGFKGIVITDDMIMYGARYGGLSMAELCEESLMAGADLILVSRTSATHQSVWNHMAELMEKNPAFRQRVKESAERVLRVKLMDLKGPDAVPYYPTVENLTLPHPEMEAFNRNLALRSVTRLTEKLTPIPRDASILVVSQDFRFAASAEEYFDNVDYFRIPRNPGAGELTAARDRLKGIMGKYDHVIISYANYRDEFILEEMSPWAPKIHMILARNPQWISETPWCTSALAIYNDSPATIEAAIAILAGYIPALGHLPLQAGEHF